MKNRLAPISVLTGGILWGTMGVFVRHFNRLGLAALDVGQIRMTAGLIMVGLYLALFHRELLRVRLRDLWCFVGTGVGSLLLMILCYYTAMEHTSLAVAGVLLYTAPIFVMLLSALLFRERITGRKLLALALAFTGCALVSGLGSDSRISPAGLLWGLGAGLSYAMYSIFGRFAIRRGYGSWTMTFWSFFFCALTGAFLCDWSAIGAVLTQPVQWGWSLLMGLVTAFLPYVLYSLGLVHMESGRASVLASLEPVVAALISVFWFHEPMGPGGILGIILVMTAIVLLSVQRKDTHVKPPESA